MPHKRQHSLHTKTSVPLALTALGVVFGDIGTSPLYALREAFHGPHAVGISPESILGVLSMVLWSLILVISIKYLLFVMRADNNGEGGVLALTAIAAPPRLVRKNKINKFALYLGLSGAALLFGDGVITPAISVMSAVEGLNVATPLFASYVVPITIFILSLLFLAQHFGTAKIGLIFGPILLLWFSVLGVLGVYGISQNMVVLGAINPIYAIKFIAHHGYGTFIVLSAVFLAVTGGEALYADMGHFGRRSIKIAWFSVALPALVLNYFGQGALMLNDPETAANPFYMLAPSWALYPLVVLSTIAAVIASQALISGVFSLTRQAIQLGYAPRFRIVHTSSETIGQIYIPHINWLLFALAGWVVLEFGTSSALAAAYGIAVSATMVITTLLACFVAIQRWRWGAPAVAGLLIFFVSIDLIYFSANIIKIQDGGWVPLVMGAVVFLCMTTWRDGRKLLMKRMQENSISFEQFLKQISDKPPVRVPGIAVFMTGDPEGTPPALVHNVKHNKAMHTQNVLLTVLTDEVPHIRFDHRVEIQKLQAGFYRVSAKYGFMETPNINDILAACKKKGVELNLPDITFFLGRETLIASQRPGMAMWRERLFSFMSRNAERATSFFNIPADQVVEVGIQVEL